MDFIFHFDLSALPITLGYLGIFFIVFAESGPFFGFFLPGDSLLFTTGLLASQGHFNIWLLIPLVFLGAVLGDQVGYAFGKKVGPKIFNREESFWFQKERILIAENFYKKHGKKTIIIARFVPIVRTFAPILAGLGKMPYIAFTSYNILGGLLWGVGITILGFFLGKIVPDIDAYLIPILAVIIATSFLPGIFSYFRPKKNTFIDKL